MYVCMYVYILIMQFVFALYIHILNVLCKNKLALDFSPLTFNIGFLCGFRRNEDVMTQWQCEFRGQIRALTQWLKNMEMRLPPLEPRVSLVYCLDCLLCSLISSCKKKQNKKPNILNIPHIVAILSVSFTYYFRAAILKLIHRFP